MSQLTKQQLQVENNTSFPNNNTNYITPALLRGFNSDLIDSVVVNGGTGSFATTGSNNFIGDQNIDGNLNMGNTGTINTNYIEAYGGQDLNLNADNVHVYGDLQVNGDISGSIVGIGNVTAYSASVDYRLNNTIGAQGATGTQGASGTNGTDGAQGATGGSGAQGATGAQGPGSAQGQVGLQGVQGYIGSQGTQGRTGAGTQGATGSTGAQGAQGTGGNQGEQGIQGATGTQGAIGPKGDQGIQGTSGANGAQGSQGTTGVGSQGATGTQGSTGAGTQGAQGTIGSQGNTGTQGATGTQGSTGAGTQGTTGAQGANGANGSQGATGAQGATGTIPNTGSFATTGSNVFIGDQTITGSVLVSGSAQYNGIFNVVTPPNVNNFIITGSLGMNDLTVAFGTTTGVNNPLFLSGSNYKYRGISMAARTGSNSTGQVAEIGVDVEAGPKMVWTSNRGDANNTNTIRFATNNTTQSIVLQTGQLMLLGNGSQTGAGNMYLPLKTPASGSVLTALDGVGNLGFTTPTGGTGTQGATGAQGAQGTIGTQGPIGSQGTTGTGTQGTTGAQGSTGAQGATGATPSTASFATTGSNSFDGNQTITGSLITTSLLQSNGGAVVTGGNLNLFSPSIGINVAANSAFSGSQYSQIFEYVDNTTDPTNVFSSVNIVDAQTTNGVGFAWSSYSGYATSTPVFFANTQYNGSDLAFGFPTNTIDVWKPTTFLANANFSGSTNIHSGSYNGQLVNNITPVSSSQAAVANIVTLTASEYAGITPQATTLYIVI